MKANFVINTIYQVLAWLKLLKAETSKKTVNICSIPDKKKSKNHLMFLKLIMYYEVLWKSLLINHSENRNKNIVQFPIIPWDPKTVVTSLHSCIQSSLWLLQRGPKRPFFILLYLTLSNIINISLNPLICSSDSFTEYLDPRYI